MESRQIKVLLVDDDKIDRMAVERFIVKQRLPYDLIVAASKTEALEKLKDDSYDVVLMDYNLQDGTGLELLSSAGDTPVVFVTGSGSEQIAVEAMREGAYDYLIKDPDRYYLTMLPSTVDNVLKRKQIEEEKEQLILDLQKALEEVKTLSGMLPICAKCKKVRDDKGYWQQIEKYIGEHSDAQFTHGLCPECARAIYPELFDKK